MLQKATFKDYIESASYIRDRLPGQPDIAIILGSGLGGFADTPNKLLLSCAY